MENIQQEEHDRLNGKWYQTYANEDGVDNPKDDKGLGTISEFKNGFFIVRSGGGDHVLEGTYEMNPKVTPPQIDWTDTAGSDSGKTFPSIYRLTNELFEFCAANEGMERPKTFEPRLGHTIRRFSKIPLNA